MLYVKLLFQSKDPGHGLEKSHKERHKITSFVQHILQCSDVILRHQQRIIF